MNTDRELLEMAAKAVGYSHLPIEGWAIDSSKGMRLVDLDHEFVCYWNPFDNDGQALRLAVSCCLPLNIEDFQTIIGPLGIREDHMADPYAATRRAIVRAAAEMGKAMS